MKMALVTGGGQGIGAAIATRLVRDGWRVVVADRADGPAQDGTRRVVADVSDEAQVAALVSGIADREGRLDGLVSNAGFMIRKPLRDLSLAEWSAVLGTNLTAAFLLARAAEPMLRAAHGSMVLMASTRARMSEPDTESYSASKGGLVALTHALAVSFGPEVRVNCISPGWINVRNEALTEEDHAQHPVGRVGRPGDVAGMAAWLLGPEAGFVTGAEFVLDGGMTRRMIYAG
jgi:NAD(P)-dependent dehydrogenase (short-subunit alcohol dehydrogenase family)